jgi:hypothetical protein
MAAAFIESFRASHDRPTPLQISLHPDQGSKLLPAQSELQLRGWSPSSTIAPTRRAQNLGGLPSLLPKGDDLGVQQRPPPRPWDRNYYPEALHLERDIRFIRNKIQLLFAAGKECRFARSFLLIMEIFYPLNPFRSQGSFETPDNAVLI